MKKLFPVFNHSFVCIGIIVVLVAGGLFAQAETNSAMGWGNGFVKTNGEYVTIGNAMYETNSPANTDEYKHYKWRDFDGKQQEDNKFTQGFGIDGIPHIFLVDKKGFLRFDNVRASDKYHAKDDTTSFEEKIANLLAEE